jgi:hypothetical protein
MTDDARHAELLAVLHEIRDAVKEQTQMLRLIAQSSVGRTEAPTASHGLDQFLDAFAKLAEIGKTGPALDFSPLRDRLSGVGAPSGEWTGEFLGVQDEPFLLGAAGLLWRWQPVVQNVYGPLCPSHGPPSRRPAPDPLSIVVRWRRDRDS